MSEDSIQAAVDQKITSQAMHERASALATNWYETTAGDPDVAEIFCYTDDMSFDCGDQVEFRISTTARFFDLVIQRDQYNESPLLELRDIPGAFQPAPKDASAAGCNWDTTTTFSIPDGTPSGFYRVTSTCKVGKTSAEQHHFIVIRPCLNQAKQSRLLMILPTATWTAYNNWGGSNHYEGIVGDEGVEFSPTLSMKRPWHKGLVRLPAGAPRIATDPKPEPGDAPRYPSKEWAYANNYSPYCAAAGWAQYDKHFVIWAIAEGLAVDMITQTDLHYRPELLNGYDAVVIVGHDEYWSADMRDNMDTYLEKGGHLARFGGNFLWQIRMEDDGQRQVCYKYFAHDRDPVRETTRAHLLTSCWEDLKVNRPGATTVGVNGFRGVYVGFGGFAPRAARGFVVYRPDHWIFAETDLYYGDLFGSEAQIFAFEVDGLTYDFTEGLPFPNGVDGAPAGIEILAMNVATVQEEAHGNDGAEYYVLDGDLDFKVLALEGEVTEELKKKHRYGSGMIIHMNKGKGSVVTAGTCEWVMGLKRGDVYTQSITRNVLTRFLEGEPK